MLLWKVRSAAVGACGNVPSKSARLITVMPEVLSAIMPAVRVALNAMSCSLVFAS